MISRLIWLFWFMLLAVITGLWSLGVWHAYTAKNWPTTEGVVIAFYGKPDYTYSVDGRTYTNSFVSCNEFFNLWSVENSAKYAVKYPLGAKVAVYFSRRRPELSALQTQFDTSGILLVVTLVLMTSVFAAGFVFGWRFQGR